MIARRLIQFAAASLALAGTLWALQGHVEDPDYPAIPFDHRAINYVDQDPADPVALLQKRMDQGEVKLEFQPKWGYLQSVLKLLGINIDSQVLVFSKTSSQISRISPATPRAIYFNDSVSIGYVQGGSVLEVAALDPKQGAVFYLLDVRKADHPSFDRQEMNCLQCHMSAATLNIPGIMVSSFYTTDNDSPYGRAGGFVTDHRIPLKDRWGGWWVTGTHGSLRHHGNSISDSFGNYSGQAADETQNVTSLADKFNTAAYPTGTSDIVALMALEHQTRMTSLMIRLGWETRVAAAEGTVKDFQPRLNDDLDEISTYMLFADEAPIRQPIQGVSTFAKTFTQRGPRDKQGRSLRDFDLTKRMFRYPLSYMIYSDLFDSLPDLARDALYRRLFDVLTGKDSDKKFARLSPDDRRAILEMVRDTKPNLAAYWKSFR